MKYSIEEIEDIKKSFKEFNINDNVKCKINTLVISLKQNKKTTFNKKEYEDWNNIRGFKITQFKKTEDLDVVKNKIKIEINKITNKNFDNIEIKLNELIKNLDNLELIEKEEIYKFIYDILSKNNFNSLINCKLLKNLLHIDSFNKEVLNRIKNYNKIFNSDLFNYNLCNVEKDYDTLCKYNESKDFRINCTNFFKDMFLLDIYDYEVLFENIFFIQDKINSIKLNNDYKNEIIELSQHVFTILDKEVILKINNYENFKKIKLNLENIKNANLKENQGLCNKVKFQHMDILDLIKIEK